MAAKRRESKRGQKFPFNIWISWSPVAQTWFLLQGRGVSDSVVLDRFRTRAEASSAAHRLTMRQGGYDEDSGRDPRRRRSTTQEERLAGIRFRIKDATEALQNAVGMQNWENVIKYAKQLQTFTKQQYASEGFGPTRRKRSYAYKGGTTFMPYLTEAQQRGRKGIPS